MEGVVPLESHGKEPVGRLECDRHGSRLAGASPAMALGRREHVGEGKGARRNACVHLMEEGTPRTGPHECQ